MCDVCVCVCVCVCWSSEGAVGTEVVSVFGETTTMMGIFDQLEEMAKR